MNSKFSLWNVIPSKPSETYKRLARAITTENLVEGAKNHSLGNTFDVRVTNPTVEIPSWEGVKCGAYYRMYPNFKPTFKVNLMLVCFEIFSQMKVH